MKKHMFILDRDEQALVDAKRQEIMRDVDKIVKIYGDHFD